MKKAFSASSTIVFLLFFELILVSHLNAQEILKEQVLEKRDKLQIMTYQGLIQTAGGKTQISDATPMIEITDLPTEGFIMRFDYKFTKYNNDFKKEWEFDLGLKRGLYGFPEGNTVGTENGFYFFDFKKGYRIFDFYVAKVQNGKLIAEITNDIKIGQARYITHFLGNNGDLNILINRGEYGELKYELLTFNQSTLKLTQEIVDLEVLGNEKREYGFRKYLWNELTHFNNKKLLVKSYVQEDHSLMLKTCELNNDGSVSNLTQYKPPLEINGHLVYEPNYLFDSTYQELYIYGLYFTEVNINPKCRGIYVMKYSYPDGEMIYNKIHSLDELKAYNFDAAEDYEKQIISVLPFFWSLNNIYCTTETPNQGMRLFLIKSIKWIKHDYSMNSIKLDQDGNIIQLDEVHTSFDPPMYMPFRLNHNSHKTLWKSEDASLKGWKKSVIDFTTSYSNNPDFLDVLWSILPREKYNIVIAFNEKKSEIRAYQVSK